MMGRGRMVALVAWTKEKLKGGGVRKKDEEERAKRTAPLLFHEPQVFPNETIISNPKTLLKRLGLCLFYPLIPNVFHQNTPFFTSVSPRFSLGLKTLKPF